MNSLVNWLDHRTGFRELLHEALYERVPGGARWRYVWGSTLVFTFVIQAISGLALWAAYSPSTRTAWESVFYIQHEMYLGSVVRGIHHFAAQAMVVLMAIHLVQVIIDGAYRAPREMNFWLGIVLMLIVLGLSLTGYLLPWDQKGYYATKVTTNIMSATPGVGPQVQILAQGGSNYGHLTLTRFFAMHAGILPALLIGFLALHIFLFRRHGLTVHDPAHAPDTTFWPDQVLRDAIACLAVLAVVLLLAIFRGAELSAPADPATMFDAARPEWYFLFLFRFLKFHAVESLGLAVAAIIIPGILMGILTVMPLTASLLGAAGHSLNKAFTWIMTIGIVGLTGLALYEDATDPDHQAALAEAHRDAGRARELASGPDKVPVEGAASLLRQDPFTQGPRLFARHCSSCHRYQGHDGRGSLVTEFRDEAGTQKSVIAAPTAVDLSGFGSREWMRSVVVDYRSHFAWLKNAGWYQQAREKQLAGEDVSFLDPDSSEMADWSGDSAAINASENAENVRALVEFLVAQARHGGTEIDQALADTGRSVALEGTWSGGASGTSCVSCHTTLGSDFTPVSDDEADGYPTLAGYASAEWLRDFIRHPNAKRHYGSKNQMPEYSPQQLSDPELDLLVRWLTHDYAPTTLAEYADRLEAVRAAIPASSTPESPSPPK